MVTPSPDISGTVHQTTSADGKKTHMCPSKIENCSPVPKVDILISALHVSLLPKFRRASGIYSYLVIFTGRNVHSGIRCAVEDDCMKTLYRAIHFRREKGGGNACA